MEIVVDLYNRMKLTVFDAYLLLSFSRGKSDIEIIFFSRRSPRDIRHFSLSTCAQGTNIRGLKTEV